MCEEECRKILKEITGKEFISAYPNWLKNPKTGRQLQLDCYNEELKLAFEYDGSHHHKTGVFAPTKEILSEIQERDRIKDLLCQKNGVRIFRLPNIEKRGIRQFLVSTWNALQYFSPDPTRSRNKRTNSEIKPKTGPEAKPKTGPEAQLKTRSGANSEIKVVEKVSPPPIPKGRLKPLENVQRPARLVIHLHVDSKSILKALKR